MRAPRGCRIPWGARAAGSLAGMALAGTWATARADEPVAAREPRLMKETAEVTSVVDAFDDDDPFDLNLILGFSQRYTHANIRREAGPGGAGSGGAARLEDVASYTSSTSSLLVGADVGLYRDLALIVRLPVILRWSQSLGDLDGSQALAATRLRDSGGGQLFSLPFTSPTRSGVDTLSVGLDWGIYNQQRDPTKPTWVIGVEGRLAVGAPLHACNANPATGVEGCPDPVTGANRDPGISRRFDSLSARTIWSRRLGYVEPYGGFSFQADFPRADGDFGKWNPTGNLKRTPPLLATVTVGVEVVPYERRSSFQRLSADFRLRGTYHSAGRDYSELFDALGSSQSPSLRTPNPAAYVAGAGIGGGGADPNAGNVYFTGVTEQQAFGSVALSASATWQAGAYVKFVVASALSYAQPHLVTAADACNPDLGTPAQAGPCRDPATGQATGTPNPDHRDVIDLAGRRFSVDDTTIVDLYVLGIVMF